MKKKCKQEKMEQIQCSMSSKKHCMKKYIKANSKSFLNCLENTTFQLLKKGERKKQKLLLCVIHLILFIFGTCRPLILKEALKSFTAVYLLNKYGKNK